MRSATIFFAWLATAPAWADTVQFSKSTYFDQHVTVEDRDDHYLVHFIVYVRLDEPPEEGSLRYLHASIAFSRGDEMSNVSRETRTVRLTQQEERWSFYFRMSKFTTQPTRTLYAVVATVDGVQGEVAAVWRFDGSRVDLGSRDNAVTMRYPVGRTTSQDDGAGNFRLVVVYEVGVHENNYDDLPLSGFLKPGKSMPTAIDGERSAKRLQ